LRKKPLPTLKSNLSSKRILREGWEKASAPRRTCAVAAPAEEASNRIALENVVVGLVTSTILAVSSAVRGRIFKWGSSKGLADKADPVIAKKPMQVIKIAVACDFIRFY
jgi:hypothetical protein